MKMIVAVIKPSRDLDDHEDRGDARREARPRFRPLVPVPEEMVVVGPKTVFVDVGHLVTEAFDTTTVVIPAKAGIQRRVLSEMDGDLGPRFRGDDKSILCV